MSDIKSVLCKFQCFSKSDVPQSDPEQPHLSNIRMGAVWEGSTEAQRQSENAIFGHWTPNGSVELTLRDPKVSEFFQPNKKYYVTITEAPN